MHGYSGTRLPQKLGLKPGLKVYVDGAPDHLDELLGGSTYTTRLITDELRDKLRDVRDK